ncbi:hypothetical protein HYU14_03240 [Candidatus Woesearchaeota archaeon]|nr:hypothetical protein [Candidatus Woesearchaeota archaeon]
MVTGEEEGVAASYNFGTEGNRSRNFIRLSKDAVYNALAVGEEVAHSIRLRLNKATRDYFLNPLNRVKEKAKEYIQRINLEEYFGRLGALWYAEHKGQKQYASLWSRLKGYTIELIKKPIEFLTHYFGYKKAEEDFKTKDIKKFRKSLYDNDPKKMSIEPEYRMAA